MPLHPIETVVIDTVSVVKDPFREELKQNPREFGSVATFRTYDLPNTPNALIGGKLFSYDAADATTADDGVTCVHDAALRRFKFNIFNSNQTISSTDAGAAADPKLILYRKSASPAASDIIGQVRFDGADSAGNPQEYAAIEATISDATSTSEDGSLDFYAHIAGTRTRYITAGRNAAGTAAANAIGLPLGQVSFPASQNASADANTLDDYEEGTWTPAVTFATPGNLNVVYGTQSGTYVKIGKRVFFSGQIITSTFTHTTAGGNFVIAGLPLTAGGGLYFAACAMGGYTKANFTHVMTQLTNASTTQNVIAGGSAQGLVFLTVADVPTGGTLNITLEGHYDI